MKNKILIALGVVAYLALATYAVVSYPQETQANPSRVNICTLEGEAVYNENYATGSLRYMTAGNSTTTLTCAVDGVDQADILVAFRASSTASTLGWWMEQSRNGVDWYAVQNDFDSGVATTSEHMASNFTKKFWKYASSTPEENQGKTDTAFGVIKVKDLATRYLRVRFFLPVASGGVATSSNAGVQAEMNRKFQRP